METVCAGIKSLRVDDHKEQVCSEEDGEQVGAKDGSARKMREEPAGVITVSPWTSSKIIISELARNANSQSPPQTY